MKTRWYSQCTYPAQSGEGLVASQLFCFFNVFFSFIQYGARPVTNVTFVKLYFPWVVDQLVKVLH